MTIFKKLNFLKRLSLLLYQCSPFNEPIYLDIINPPKNKFFRIILKTLFFISNKTELFVNARIVEIPFAFNNIDLKKGSKILDFGCNESKVSLQLASLGYKVTGIDLSSYEFKHPNFRFIKGDFLNNNFKDEYFDAVIAISSIEHVGLNVYDSEKYEDGDRRIVDEIYRILKKDGLFIITVPYGEKKVALTQRFYDEKSLKSLIKSFKIKKEKYFKRLGKEFWIPCNKTYNKKSVACLVCKK